MEKNSKLNFNTLNFFTDKVEKAPLDEIGANLYFFNILPSYNGICWKHERTFMKKSLLIYTWTDYKRKLL